MKEIKHVLLFLSFSMGAFVVHLFVNLLFFTVMNSVLLAGFYMALKSADYTVFTTILAAVVLLVFFVRPRLFVKRRLGMNLHFLDFLDRFDEQANTLAPAKEGGVTIPAHARLVLKEYTAELKKKGGGFLMFKLRLALTAGLLSREKKGTSEVWSLNFGFLKSQALRVSLLELLGFVVLLVPFGSVSFLFTMGMADAVKGLVYVLGFFFAWFLHAAIILPITGLILQKRIEK